MRKLLLILLAVISLQVNAQDKKVDFKDIFKFGTVYGAINGGTSLSDEDQLFCYKRLTNISQ